MFKIRYYYSSLPKQLFIIVLMMALLVRFTLFFAGGFYKESYVGATVFVYLLALIVCVFFLVGWRFFYSEFNEDTIVYHNLLLKKKTGLELAAVSRALFSKSGISLFYEEEERPRFFVPFHRFGVVSPVGVENFMNLMKNRRVKVEQTYETLPGFGASSKWFSRGYIVLSLLLLINTFQYGILVFLILTA